MTTKDILEFLEKFSVESNFNYVDKDIAFRDDLIGMKMYEYPIIGISSANDDLFNSFKDEKAIGEKFRLPKEWLKEAKTIISIFYPLTDQIKNSNVGGDFPSLEWFHGRIEGHKFVLESTKTLANKIISLGGKAIVPALDENFKIYKEPKIYSNWSERHIAYVSGLGTFSKNRGVITEKGIAGRFCSIITNLDLAPTTREYKGLYDNCILCKACEKSCPVDAINSFGKNQNICDKFLESIKKDHAPWYGCGKCQAGMPCESSNPRRKVNKNIEFDYSNMKNISNEN